MHLPQFQKFLQKKKKWWEECNNRRHAEYSLTKSVRILRKSAHVFKRLVVTWSLEEVISLYLVEKLIFLSFLRDVLLWIPTHGRAKAGWPARTYIQQLCEDTGCCPEDLPRAMNDREEWRERVRDIRATSAIWWWWWYSTIQPITIFTNPSAQAGYDTRSIFKRSLTGLNSEFSFS